MNLNLEQAQEMLKKALASAKENNLLMNVAVVDSGANLIAFGRMYGARLGSKDISIKKAKTSVFFGMNRRVSI